MPIADRTILNNVTQNLDIGDVADPALRLAFFQYVMNLFDANYAEFQAYGRGRGYIINCGTFTAPSSGILLDGGYF